MTTLKKIFAASAALALVLSLVFAFTSCGFLTPEKECADNNSDHLCDDCGSILSECSDANSDHNCDLCGKALTECADANSDHKCDSCNAVLSDCVDEDRDHVCDLCNQDSSECADENRDHYCDICDAVLSKCADEDKNHRCDICGDKRSDCYDGDKNHVCDICGGKVGNHADGDVFADGHFCNYCNESLCKDGKDDDHNCDECLASLCVDADANCQCDECYASLCVDLDPIDHYCDVCGSLVSDCADGIDGNHDCDICYKSVCADENSDCICDGCGASLCVDANADHKCDACAKSLCYDSADRGHTCDVCYASLCSDANEDHECDVCGELICVDCLVHNAPVISVYVEGANCTFGNGSQVVRFSADHQGSYDVVPVYNASEYVIDFWFVYDANNVAIAVIENGDAFVPTSNGSYYIIPVFIANNFGGISDSDISINVSDNETVNEDGSITENKVSDAVLDSSWANEPLANKLLVINNANQSIVGTSKNAQFYIMVDPHNAANAVLVFANRANSTSGYGNSLIKVGIDSEAKGDTYVIELDYFLDFTYCNSNATNFIRVTDGEGIWTVATIEQMKQSMKLGVNDNVPVDNAFAFVSRNAAGSTTKISAKLKSDTWYSFRVEIFNHVVKTYWSLRGSDEWTLLDTQDFSSISISEKNLNSIVFEANYYNNNSICYIDNIFFGRGHNCVDSDNNHYCDECDKPLCYDGIDADHNCDRCDAVLCYEGDIADHYCDECGKTLSECADNDKSHYCDVCGKGGFGGDCADGEDEGHDCDYCNKNLCDDANKDHKCDECGAELSKCADADKNHVCDYCETVISACEDLNTDHKCDYCKGEMNMDQHVDADGDGDHVCDYGCGATISEHTDADSDYVCNECNAALCCDLDFDHICDIEDHKAAGEKLSECVDADKNHTCDFAGCHVTLSECSDGETLDHICDYCQWPIAFVCADENGDHFCDLATCHRGRLSYCADSNADHKCDVCSKDLCVDADGNRVCDVCNSIIALDFETGYVGSDDNYTIINAVSTTNKPLADQSNVISHNYIDHYSREAQYGSWMKITSDPEDAANAVLQFETKRVEGGGANAPTGITAAPVIVDADGAYTVMKFRMYIDTVSGSAKAYHDVLYLKMYDAAGKEKKAIIGYRSSTTTTNAAGETVYKLKSCGADINATTNMWIDLILVNDSTQNKYFAYYSVDGGKTYTYVNGGTTGLTGNLASVKIDTNAYQVNSNAYIDNWTNTQVSSVSIPLTDGTTADYGTVAAE